MTFSLPLYFSIIPVVIALVGFTFGGVLWRWQSLRPVAIATFVGAALFGVLFGPMLFLDRVTIDDDAVSQRTGFWFAPTRHRLEFDEVRHLLVLRTPRASGPTNTKWHVIRRDGTDTVLDPGDLWDLNEGAILTAFRNHGVPVSVATGAASAP
jgi:hypothetical protein